MANVAYTIIVEHGDHSYGAYAPDLPGCVAVADTVSQVVAEMKEAIEFHIEGLRLEGLPVPSPRSTSLQLEVELPPAA